MKDVDHSRNLCFGKTNRFNHNDLGWNYRITSIQAAIGISQLKRIDSIVKKKMYIGNYYYQKLIKNRIFILHPKIFILKNIYWVVGILIRDKKILASKIIKN